MALDEHMPQNAPMSGYGIAYGGPSDPMAFDDWWEREASTGLLPMEYAPSTLDAYGMKRVMPEQTGTFISHTTAPHDPLVCQKLARNAFRRAFWAFAHLRLSLGFLSQHTYTRPAVLPNLASAHATSPLSVAPTRVSHYVALFGI